MREYANAVPAAPLGRAGGGGNRETLGPQPAEAALGAASARRGGPF